MDWRRRPGDDPADPHGVADLLARACESVATTAVEGTRFVFSTKEMMRVTREIEQAALIEPEDPLFVGVQHGHRLDAQGDIYNNLLAAGVDVVGFGIDEGTDLGGVTWIQVPDHPNSLAASWFLIRSGRHAHALVGFEVGEPVDGVRQWEGFESRDARLVEGVIEHLDDLAGARLDLGSMMSSHT